MNVWLALDRCGGGTETPGLEVVPHRCAILPTGTHGAIFDWSIGPDLITQTELSGAGPVYEPGDALIFDQRTVHRTGFRPGLTAARHAIEAWFFAPSSYDVGERGFVFSTLLRAARRRPMSEVAARFVRRSAWVTRAVASAGCRGCANSGVALLRSRDASVRVHAARVHVDRECCRKAMGWACMELPDWLRLEEACADGDSLRAIDVLTEANRLGRNGWRERRLVELRREAVAGLDRTPGRSTWPPAFPDPFPGDALPTVPVDELSLETVGGGLLHHGAVYVQGLLDADAVAVLVDCIDHTLDEASAWTPGEAPAGDDPWFVPHGGRELFYIGVNDAFALMSDSPRTLFEYAEQLGPVVRGLVTEYLGERPVMASNKWTLRRITPQCIIPQGEGGWHQDGRFLGADIRVLNVWLALDRCGGGTPAAGLEVVPRRLDILPTGTLGARFEWSIGPQVVRETYPVVDPVYEPGDALIFDQMTVHRTGARPELTADRHAIEAWFFAPSSFETEERTFVF